MMEVSNLFYFIFVRFKLLTVLFFGLLCIRGRRAKLLYFDSVEVCPLW